MAGDTAARADALLAELELDEGAGREACIVLAGVALSLADGDPEAAKGPLAEVLTAIGAMPYEGGGVQTFWGVKPRHGEARSEEESA